MSGFINPDGSGLVGGQKSGGVGQSLQLDASGNLLVNVAVGGGGGGGSVVNIADPATPANKLGVDASGRIAVNIAQIAGAAPTMSTADGVAGSSVQLEGIGIWNGTGVDRVVGLHGAMSVQDWLRYLILKGQAFTTSTGVVTSSATAGLYGFSLFNPTGSGKTLLVYSLKSLSLSGGTQPQTSVTTADPALGTAPTILNDFAGSGQASIASASYSAGVVAVAGTIKDVGNIANTGYYDVFDNGHCQVLPPGNGVAHYVYVAASSKYAMTACWVEF